MSTKIKSGVRAVADVEAGRILASVEIAAPVERVFRALSTSEITEWWGSPDLYRTTSFVADLRPGGTWSSSGVGADGKPFSVGGRYVEVAAPHKLVHTWVPEWDPGVETTITYRLEAIEGGTRLTLRHDGFGDHVASCEGHANGWERVFGWLTHYLNAAPEARFFVCRLLGPRPTFPADITPEEMDLMRAHAAYWRTQMDAGSVLVFGPVADPRGPGAWPCCARPTRQPSSPCVNTTPSSWRSGASATRRCRWSAPWFRADGGSGSAARRRAGGAGERGDGPRRVSRRSARKGRDGCE